MPVDGGDFGIGGQGGVDLGLLNGRVAHEAVDGEEFAAGAEAKDGEGVAPGVETDVFRDSGCGGQFGEALVAVAQFREIEDAIVGLGIASFG